MSTIREIHPEESIPYSLLLLADEERTVVDKYIENAIIYLYFSEGHPLGVCAVERINDDVQEIKNLGIHPEHRQKGIGRKLLRFALTQAAGAGYSYVDVGTADTSDVSQKLYTSEGFEHHATRPDFFLTHYSQPVFENGKQCRDMVVYRKEI